MSALCALLLACSKEAAPSSEAAPVERAAPLEKVALAKLAQPVDPRFDAQGKLKPSGRRVVWFELPMGFTELPGSTDRAAVFEASDMPYDVVRDYLDERLAAQKLELVGKTLHFGRAKPTYTQLAMEPLNVTLLETDAAKRTVRLQIAQLTRKAERTLTVEGAKELLARDRQRIQ